MKNNLIRWDLIKRWLNRQMTDEVTHYVKTWSAKDTKNSKVLAELRHRWDKKDMEHYKAAEAFERLAHRIHQSSYSEDISRKNQFIGYLKVAASVLALLSFSFVLYHFWPHEYPEEIAYITKATKANQRSVVRLSDGTVVMLNVNSSLKYPEVFQSDKREVVLTGEAFFQVEEDPEKPFIVKTEHITTTVLGTTFNVRAFQGSDIEVTVASGNVKVSSHNTQTLDLERGEQAVCHRDDNLLQFREVDPEKYLAWYNRKLQYNRIAFGEVLALIEKMYHVDIIVKKDHSNNCQVRVMYDDESLENVLKGMQMVVDFDYEYQNDSTIIVNGNGCMD